MAFLDTYEVVLLDMCNTIMFDLDNFSETYRCIGGLVLDNTMIQKWLRGNF
ncbi:hypothetical protein KAH55_03430 [bacterium]|nr:hypothetical protein [bacterium]